MSVNESTRNSTIAVAVVLAVVVLTGCDDRRQTDDESPTVAPTAEERVAPAPPEPEAVRADDLVGAWLLEDLGGRGVMDTVETTIVFDDDGGVSGSGGCNRYTGSYTLENGQLDLGPMAATKMMCSKAVMEQETGFLVALGEIERVAVDGPSLLITFAGSEMPLRFTRTDQNQID